MLSPVTTREAARNRLPYFTLKHLADFSARALAITHACDDDFRRPLPRSLHIYIYVQYISRIRVCFSDLGTGRAEESWSSVLVYMCGTRPRAW
jgi:hypothetical protein